MLYTVVSTICMQDGAVTGPRRPASIRFRERMWTGGDPCIGTGAPGRIFKSDLARSQHSMPVVASASCFDDHLVGPQCGKSWRLPKEVS